MDIVQHREQEDTQWDTTALSDRADSFTIIS
jgi:hypothetical protein